MHSDHQEKKYKNNYYSVRVEGSTPHKPCNGINCYTDGSLMEQGSGAGIRRMDMPYQGISISLGKHTPVFQAEVFAINICAQNLIKEGMRERLITIYTDNQAVIYALDNYITRSKLVKECKANLNSPSLANKVRVEWVPEHKGIKRNERADYLARKGFEYVPLTPDPICGISISHAKRHIKKMAKSKAGLLWRNTRGMEQSKMFLKGSCPKRSNCLLNIHRSILRWVTGLYTGHCQLNKHLYKMRLIESPIFRFCRKDEEIAYHIICRGDVAARTRFLIFGKDRILDLKLCETVDPYTVSRFAKAIGLF
ncbi:uncharacterized protein [Halyomorpha halys]|uniref:uncharacterized protein n=1 Tax=Halyomorpha halys TaxID=286706 RepID=UPI0006D4D5C4|nr:uncharacterized protein LOC106691320 [Halyomorpha halys]